MQSNRRCAASRANARANPTRARQTRHFATRAGWVGFERARARGATRRQFEHGWNMNTALNEHY
eukprot:10202915-Lingulodinium_polyedra.AAC.1